MLPAHYQVRSKRDDEDDDDDNDTNDVSSFGTLGRQLSRPSSFQPASPPLGLTGVLCTSKNLKIPNRGSLHYVIFRPRHLGYKPPLLCAAGGPLLPHIYLQSIVHVITDRSIIFFDAIGCGQSKSFQSRQPQKPASDNKTPTDVHIPSMVQDFAKLVEHLALKNFHALGHSFGGIILYEYLKKKMQQSDTTCACLSLILVSTPVSISAAIQNSEALKQQLKARHGHQAGGNDDDDDDTSDDDDDDNNNAAILAEFARLHECRLSPLPMPLQQSLMGVFSSASKGLEAVHDYDAVVVAAAAAAEETAREKNDDDNDEAENNGNPRAAAQRFPPCLVLRGQYDFVSAECQEQWGQLLGGIDNVQFATIANSAHYSMLENEEHFARAVLTFLPDPAVAAFVTLPNGVKVRR